MVIFYILLPLGNFYWIGIISNPSKSELFFAKSSNLPRQSNWNHSVAPLFFVGGELEDGLVLLAGDAVAVGVFDLGPGALGEDGA